ncbi:MAG TPA: hypothetical protein VM370_07490 [Candidatus Thermoplasmatota archaeon]|nr:hypothetical protein [Candidatus Thermoplasmatota archaeon]
MEDSAFAPGFRTDLLEKLPPARLLVLLAGASALVLGALVFVLQLAMGPLEGPLGFYGRTAVIVTLVVNLAFGALLLYSYLGMHARPIDWAILVLAFSLVLLVMGGLAGAIAGILGLVAGISVFVRAGKPQWG